MYEIAFKVYVRNRVVNNAYIFAIISSSTDKSRYHTGVLHGIDLNTVFEMQIVKSYFQSQARRMYIYLQ